MDPTKNRSTFHRAWLHAGPERRHVGICIIPPEVAYAQHLGRSTSATFWMSMYCKYVADTLSLTFKDRTNHRIV